MDYLFKSIKTTFLIIAFLVGFTSCDSEDEPSQDDSNNETTFDISNIAGLWMESDYTELKSEQESNNETTYLDGYSYKYCRFSINEDETIKAEWLSYPSLSVIDTYTLTIDLDKIYRNNQMIGTITKCVKKGTSSNDPALTIKWETNATPFNLNSKYRVIANYILDTCTK